MTCAGHTDGTVNRTIEGFHQDDDGDWVAELSCGHNQHVRHRPPFQERPWVTSSTGRTGRVGTALRCPLCERAELPEGLRWVRSSPVWDEHTIPGGLRRAHRLATGTWATITVHSGALSFSMRSEPTRSIDLDPDSPPQAIPPEVEHEIAPLGAVRLSMQFFTVDRAATELSARRPAADAEAATEEGGETPCLAASVCPECQAVLIEGRHRMGCPAAGPEP